MSIIPPALWKGVYLSAHSESHLHCRLTQNPLTYVRLSSMAVDISHQDSHVHCFVLICGSAWRV